MRIIAISEICKYILCIRKMIVHYERHVHIFVQNRMRALIAYNIVLVGLRTPMDVCGIFIWMILVN